MFERTKKVLDYLYWDVYFTAGFSMMAGLGNAFSAVEQSFDHAFGEGFINNAKLGILMNLVFPLIQDVTKESTHYRRNAHIVNTAINAGFLGWHYFTGTENPIQSILPCYAVGAVMSERMASDLEKRVQE